MTIGEKIKKLRKERGMTQVELANLSGITQQVISHYESNRNGIGVVNLGKLAKALGCSPLDIDDRADGLATSPEERARVRRVDDDILLYIVDNWTELSVDTRAEIAGLVAADGKRRAQAAETKKPSKKSG